MLAHPFLLLFCFILPFNCRGVVVCFSFSFCNTGISVKSMLLFSGVAVWPWQLLEIELSHCAAARTMGNVLLSTSTMQPANLLRCFHRRRRKTEAQQGEAFFLIYTSICIWAALSLVTHTKDFKFLMLWFTTSKEIAGTPNTLTFPTFVFVQL